MAEAKLAPNLPDWMLEHANRYIASGGTEGHMYKVTLPQRGEITAPALLLTATGRKSGDKFIFPLFYGTDGGSYFVVASKGGAPQHPGWYRNILANPDVEIQVGTKRMNARARTTAGEERLRLWKKALEFWPPYADYQLKTEREIPVVALDPVHYHTWRHRSHRGDLRTAVAGIPPRRDHRTAGLLPSGDGRWAAADRKNPAA